MSARRPIIRKPHRHRVSAETNMTPDGGYNFNRSTRFQRLSQIFSRYERARTKHNKTMWAQILAQYARKPYQDTKTGQVMPNFGTLRSKVDERLTGYTDFATERDLWHKIETDYGIETSQNKEWSDHISTAFQRFCIKKWKQSFAELQLSCTDMLLHSKGSFMWWDRRSPYPESTPIGNVYPDANAGMFPKSFDILFVEREFTAVELYRKIRSEPAAKKKGWIPENVRKVLTSNSMPSKRADGYSGSHHEDGDSAADNENIIQVVYAFVMEYKSQSTDGEDMEGDEDRYDYDDVKKVSLYIFPAAEFIPKVGDRSTPEEDQDSAGYFCYSPHALECMDEVISVIGQSVCRNFYEEPSYAQLVYTLSKTYDMVMNRILQAIEDNMRLYLSSETPEIQRKLQQMKHGNTMVLEPGVKLVQERIIRPVQEPMLVLQTLVRDQESNLGVYKMGGSAPNGEAKTARQNEIELSESVKISGSSMKIFNCFMTMMGWNIYCKFVTMKKEEVDECHWKNFQKFKKYLKSRNVPDAAWNPENVDLASVLNMGAGSPAAKLQGARVVRQALAVAPRTPGERKAQRDEIAAVVGVENVDGYMPPEDELNIPEDSLVGLENDGLASPGSNPQNFPVVATQLHLRHIPRHVADAEISLNKAAEIWQKRGELFPVEDEGIAIQIIQDILIGVDNVLSHTQAHIQVAQTDANKIDELKGWMVKINEINKQQDKFFEILGERQTARIQEARERNGTDPQVQHQAIMNQMLEQHTARMLDFDFQKAQMKTAANAEGSQVNSETKRQLQTVETLHKTSLAEVEAASRIRIEEAKAKAASKNKPSQDNGKAKTNTSKTSKNGTGAN